MNKLAAMFPGQGSQYVGMAKNLYEEHTEVQELFKEAEQILGIDLYHLCCFGPEKELQKTENTQPAILTASVAAFRIYLKEGGRLPEFSAGHSLGEITALCCAGAVSFADALHIVRLRGKLMQEAVPEGMGAMAAVTGMNAQRIEKICESISTEDNMAVVSNYNAPSQTVISGDTKAVETASNLLKEDGGMVIPLKVSAPFHSPLMTPCANKLKSTLEQVTYYDFEFPVISNTTGEPYKGKEQIAEYLYKQIINPVLWHSTMRYLHMQGVDTVIEFGPKSVLKDLSAKNIPSIKAYSFEQDRLTIQKVILSWGKTYTKIQRNIFAKCLAAAVSTKNNTWDENEYQAGVVEPYKELLRLAAEVRENQIVLSEDDVNKGMEYLRKILKTKQVPLLEQQTIEKEILNAI